MKTEEFDGPRQIQRPEIRSARQVLKLCFGDEFNDPMDEVYEPPPRGGWFVMLSKSGALQGKVVSQIGASHHVVEFEGSKLHIGSIGGVSTHPDFRNQGLAGRLLVHCTHTLRDEGARLMMISGGRGLYTRSGNVPAMRFNSFNLKSNPALRNNVQLNVNVRPLTEADAPTCARIYQSDPVHYLRQTEDYHYPHSPGDSWMVEQDGKAAACLLLRLPWEFMDTPGCNVRQVVEYGGSREALAEGIQLMLAGGCEAFNQAGIRELRLEAAWQDTQFARQLAEMGTKEDTLPLDGHTMRLVNFPALRSDLEAYITSRLTETVSRDLRFEQTGPLLEDPDDGAAWEGRCAIGWQQQRLELSTADMTQLVMGSPHQADKPILPAESELSRIVQALFPLPSFLPGLNYR